MKTFASIVVAACLLATVVQPVAAFTGNSAVGRSRSVAHLKLDAAQRAYKVTLRDVAAAQKELVSRQQNGTISPTAFHIQDLKLHGKEANAFASFMETWVAWMEESSSQFGQYGKAATEAVAKMADAQQTFQQQRGRFLDREADLIRRGLLAEEGTQFGVKIAPWMRKVYQSSTSMMASTEGTLAEATRTAENSRAQLLTLAKQATANVRMRSELLGAGRMVASTYRTLGDSYCGVAAALEEVGDMPNVGDLTLPERGELVEVSPPPLSLDGGDGQDQPQFSRAAMRSRLEEVRRQQGR